MDHLSYTEACFVSRLSALTDPEDIEKITTFLWDIFLTQFEKSNGEFLLKKMEEFQEKNTLFPMVDRLKNLGFIEVRKKISFPNFVIHNIERKNQEKFFIKASAKDNFVLDCCDAKASRNDAGMASFEAHKKKHSKYEIRLFWPSPMNPKVCDLHDLIFNEKYYSHKSTKDKYIIERNKFNIKVRDNELQVKEFIESIGSITHFKKKKVFKFPIKGKELEKIIQQKMISDDVVFETPEEFLMKLSHSPVTVCVEVLKERYVRKMADHTKIEIALIKTQKKAWQTICIESKSLEKVLALSLLINQKHAEKLSYDEFFQKHVLSPINTK